MHSIVDRKLFFRKKKNYNWRRQEVMSIARNIQHAASGLIILKSLQAHTILTLVGLTFIAVMILWIWETGSPKWIHRIIMTVFRQILRPREMNRDQLPGAFWFLVGIVLSTIFLSREVSREVILAHSLGDPIVSFSVERGLLPSKRESDLTVFQI
eukprot:Trichotokara_eunicae@DN5715_c0_g1_i1.p1